MPDGAQELLPALFSEDHAMAGIKPTTSLCKASTHPLSYLSHPVINRFSYR